MSLHKCPSDDLQACRALLSREPHAGKSPIAALTFKLTSMRSSLQTDIVYNAICLCSEVFEPGVCRGRENARSTIESARSTSQSAMGNPSMRWAPYRPVLLEVVQFQIV